MKRLLIIGFTLVLVGGCMSTSTAESMVCKPDDSGQSILNTGSEPLPVRDGPRTVTSGRVPHVQIGVNPVTEVVEELRRLAFTLPGVEARPTIVSLPGATGMWLSEDLPVVHPLAIVSGREFAHIHSDGSLHAPLPFERAMELAEKGWGERHPWAESQNGWEGLVMLYTPASMEELDVILQLTTESYNYVTGLNVQMPGC